MEIIKFNLDFSTTPLLIGGAKKKVDQNGLSGKALRGSWRFWCRAIIGGMVNDINWKDLSNLESKIFGSANSEYGAKFRLIVEEHGSYKAEKYPLGFIMRNGRPAEKDGFYDVSYTITIIPRKTMDKPEINILFATIWLWGNLGALGNRARRGFGSPVIYIENESKNPFELKISENKTISLATIKEKKFKDSNKLNNHLSTGINNVWEVYQQWINNSTTMDAGSNNIAANSSPTEAPYFILRSLDQIAVSSSGYQDGDQAIQAVHGRGKCKDLGWAMGGRMASPVFIRFHKVMKNGNDEIVPVITWCKQKGVPNTGCAKKYLTEINLTNSLSGAPL